MFALLSHSRNYFQCETVTTHSISCEGRVSQKSKFLGTFHACFKHHTSYKVLFWLQLLG